MAKKVLTSQLGVFIRLIKADNPNITRENLCKEISQEFDVECTLEDLETFYAISDVLHEDYELESRKIQYNVKSPLDY